jgi:plastocyanin
MSKAKLTASEWELVKNAPYWVNQVLAEADGRVSFFTKRREGKALEKAITGYKTKSALVNDIIADDSDAPKEIGKASQDEAEKTLGRIAAIVEEKLGADDLAELKDFLLKVGNEVASSSKEGGTGIAKEVSAKEAAALTRLESVMKVSASYGTAHTTTAPKPAAKPSSSAKPAPAPAPAKRDDDAKQEADAKAREEAAKKQAEARERLEKAREEAEAKAEAKKKDEAKERLDAARKEAEERQAEAKAKAEAEAAKAREEAARKEAEAKAAASAPKYKEFIAEHTVQPGDNLSFISQRYYGHQANFRIIYEANRDVIGDNMNIIVPGQVLKIPKL